MLNQKSLVSGSLWDGSLWRRGGVGFTHRRREVCPVTTVDRDRPEEQRRIGQEVIYLWDVDQSEAEDRNVGVGCKNPGDAGWEGHGQVTRDFHQTSAEEEGKQESGWQQSQRDYEDHRVSTSGPHRQTDRLTGCVVHLWSRRWRTRLWLLPQATPPVCSEKWDWALWTRALWGAERILVQSTVSDDFLFHYHKYKTWSDVRIMHRESKSECRYHWTVHGLCWSSCCW